MAGPGEVHPLRLVRDDAKSRGRVDGGRDHGDGQAEGEGTSTGEKLSEMGFLLRCLAAV